MKATLHFGNGIANHNDRNFDFEKAEHIDSAKSPKNLAINYTNNPLEKNMSFEDFEKLYYKKKYSEALEQTNNNYKRNGHSEKCRTMDDWYKSFKPTEAIFQIGNQTDQIEPKKLLEAFLNFSKRINIKYPNVQFLNIALHQDESTPHIHLRFVIEGFDRNGLIKPLKTKGLKDMGIERPDLSKPEGRYNNPLMTFTAECRTIFYEEIEKIGLEIDKEPYLNQQHLDTLQFKKNAIANDIESLAEQSQELQEASQELEEKKEELKSEIKNLGKELKGKKLELSDIQELNEKNIWTKNEKENLLKTAFTNAKNEEKILILQGKLKAKEKELKKEKAEKEELKKELPTFDIKAEHKAFKKEIERLREDIAIRDDFIKEKNLKESFISYCFELGYKLKVALEKIYQERVR